MIVGSEGALGITSAATLKLSPMPAARLTAWAAVSSMQHAVTLLGPAHQHLGAGLTGLEVVMGQITLSLVAKHYPKQRVRCGKTRYCLLLEKSDHEGETHAKEKPATSRFFLASLLSYPGAHFAFFKNPVKIYETLIRIRISLKK